LLESTLRKKLRTSSQLSQFGMVASSFMHSIRALEQVTKTGMASDDMILDTRAQSTYAPWFGILKTC
jgi:hypothetical protein